MKGSFKTIGYSLISFSPRIQSWIQSHDSVRIQSTTRHREGRMSRQSSISSYQWESLVYSRAKRSQILLNYECQDVTRNNYLNTNSQCMKLSLKKGIFYQNTVFERHTYTLVPSKFVFSETIE